MESIQLLHKEWGQTNATLVQSHKDHSPKEEWGEPKSRKVRPLDQPKVEQVVEKLQVVREKEILESWTTLFTPLQQQGTGE